MKAIQRATCAAAMLCGALTAQTVKVAPIDHTNPGGGHINGSTWTNRYPLSAGVSRTMYLYETSSGGRTLLDIPNGRQITHVGFPREENSTSFGHAIRLQIFMGDSTRTAANADSTYLNNYSPGSRTEVFTLKTFTLPNLGDVTSPPIAEVVWIPLDTPYTFDSTQNLLVEYCVFANSNSNMPFDYRLDVGTDISPVESFGQPCQTSGGAQPSLQSGETAIGETWRLTLRNGPGGTGSANAALHVGLSELTPPIPIPGAPGCSIHVAPLVSIGGATSTNGTATWSFPTPNDAAIWQASLYSQVLALDFFANATGVVVSNGDKMTFGINPRIARVWRVGDLTNPIGFVIRSFGQLSLFRHN